MPRITIRFALIALLLAAIVPTATGIGVSAYLNWRATVELLWQDLADEMIEDARQKALRYVESGTAQLRLSRLLTEQCLINPSDREGLLNYLHRCLLAHANVTWCSYGGADGAYLAAHREPDGSLRLTRREQEGGGTRYRDYRVKPGAADERDARDRRHACRAGPHDRRLAFLRQIRARRSRARSHGTRPGGVAWRRNARVDGLLRGYRGFHLHCRDDVAERSRRSARQLFRGDERGDRAEHGTVDKFIGDATMAFWGAPQDVQDHAFRACKAALLCQARLAELRPAWADENRATFRAYRDQHR